MKRRQLRRVGGWNGNSTFGLKMPLIDGENDQKAIEKMIIIYQGIEHS